MRYFSHVTTAQHITKVEGRESLNQSDILRLINFIEIDPTPVEDLVTEMILRDKRTAREMLQGLIAPNDYRMFNDLRLWLNRLERGEWTAANSILGLYNLNKGVSLIYVAGDQSAIAKAISNGPVGQY